MTWASLDDGFHEDPRTLQVGLAAVGLYALATCYVARHLLDGVIPRLALVRWLDHGDTAPLDELLSAGLMIEGDDAYTLTRYFEGNETRAEVLKRREEKKAKAKKAAEKRWGKKPSSKAKPVGSDDPNWTPCS